MGAGVGGGASACCTGAAGAIGAAVAPIGAGGSDAGPAGPSSMTISTESGPDALAGGCVVGKISKDRNNVRCSASESKASQPSVSRRCTRIPSRWLLLSIDRTGPSGASSHDALLCEIVDPSGKTEPTLIRHGGASSCRCDGRLPFLQVGCGISGPETRPDCHRGPLRDLRHIVLLIVAYAVDACLASSRGSRRAGQESTHQGQLALHGTEHYRL